jgi:WD40 repeat protein
MDGSINLWHAKRSKPVFKNQEAHSGWICALDSLKQSNIFASGGTDSTIKIWGIDAEMKGMTKLR